MNEIYAWFREQYIDHIDLKLIEGSKKYKRDIASHKCFPLYRMMSFINLKYSLSMKTSGYTYVPFSLIRGSDRVIYSIVYFLETMPKFICLSPTFVSSKGEFRDGFIKYEEFDIALNKFTKKLSIIEEIISKKINKGEMSIDYSYYPSNKSLNEDLSMLGLQALISSIYLILYKKNSNQLQVHTDKMYIDILKDIKEFEEYKIENDNIYNYLFKGGLDRPFGQKLIPLSVGEAVKINNISFSSWRELFISYATSDMVINFICPNFAIAANWTYIEGSNSKMYDNKLIVDKYIQNEEIKDVSDRLKELYKFSETVDNIDNSREKIYDTLIYLNSHKLLSEISLARIDEFAGVTIGTIPRTIKTAKVIPPKYKKFITNIDFFNKVIFDLLYGCFVLHKRIGAIHLDLHKNNMTIMDVDYNFYKLEDGKYKYIKDHLYSSMYIIDGQRETYIFPFEGYYGTIIDFSDSVVNKDFLLYTQKYVTYDSFENIIDRERNYIFDKLSSMLNYVKKNKDKVRGKIISDYENMFKAISAIDFVYILTNIRTMFEKELSDQVDKKILEHIKYMEDTSLEFLLESVQNVVDNEGNTLFFAGEILLKKFFAKYLYHNVNMENINIYEVYNFNCKWEGRGVYYDDFPNWANKNDLIKKFGNKKIEELLNVKTLPINIERDTHLAYIIEKMSSEHGDNIMQTSITPED